MFDIAPHICSTAKATSSVCRGTRTFTAVKTSSVCRGSRILGVICLKNLGYAASLHGRTEGCFASEACTKCSVFGLPPFAVGPPHTTYPSTKWVFGHSIVPTKVSFSPFIR